MAEHDFTIKIDDEHLIDAVATRVLGMYTEEGYDDEGEPLPKGSGRDSLAKIIEQTVIKRVQRAVDDQVKAVTAEKIGAAVDAILTTGWQATNNYGESTGKSITLRDRVSKIITDAQAEGWNNNRKTLIDAIIERRVSELLDPRSGGEFGKALAEAQKALRDAVDGQVMASLNATLRSALGLR